MYMYASLVSLEEMQWLANDIIAICKKPYEYQSYGKICICVVSSFYK